MITCCTVPEIYCTKDRWTGRWTAGKNDIQRWVYSDIVTQEVSHPNIYAITAGIKKYKSIIKKKRKKNDHLAL